MKRTVLVLGWGLLALIGCGGGGGGGIPFIPTGPTPAGFSGSASNATLNGTYVYGFLGVDDDGPCGPGPVVGGFAYDEFGSQTFDGAGTATPSGVTNDGCAGTISALPGAGVAYNVSANGILTTPESTGRLKNPLGNVVVGATLGAGEYGFGLVARAAGSGFDLSSIQGRYSFITLYVDQGTGEIETLSGVITFDGVDSGGGVGGATASVIHGFNSSGSASGATASGTYTVAADGSVSVTIPGLDTVSGRIAAGNGFIVYTDQTTPGEILLGIAAPNATPAGTPSPAPPDGGTFAYAGLRLAPGVERRSEVGTIAFSANSLEPTVRWDFTSNSSAGGVASGTEFGSFAPSMGGFFQFSRGLTAAPAAPVPSDDLLAWVSTDGGAIAAIENQSKTGGFSALVGVRY